MKKAPGLRPRAFSLLGSSAAVRRRRCRHRCYRGRRRLATCCRLARRALCATTRRSRLGRHGTLRAGPLRARALRRRTLGCGALGSGALRRCPLRSRPLGGRPLRGGPLRSAALRGGALRTGALRGGPLRSRPLRSAALRCGATPGPGALRCRLLGGPTAADCATHRTGRARLQLCNGLLEVSKPLLELADRERFDESLHCLQQVATGGGSAPTCGRPHAPHGAFDGPGGAASTTPGSGHMRWTSNC